MAFYSNSLNFPNLTSKATPVGADIIMIGDSAAGNIPKQCLISSLPFAPSAGLSIVNVTAATQALAKNSCYFVNYTGGACTLTLPAAGSSTQGDEIEVIGGESATNPFVLAANASQQFRMVDQTTTATTGTLTAVTNYASLLMRCSSFSGGLVWTVVRTMSSFAGT